jgi:hypothetical protein
MEKLLQNKEKQVSFHRRMTINRRVTVEVVEAVAAGGGTTNGG